MTLRAVVVHMMSLAFHSTLLHVGYIYSAPPFSRQGNPSAAQTALFRIRHCAKLLLKHGQDTILATTGMHLYIYFFLDRAIVLQ